MRFIHLIVQVFVLFIINDTPYTGKLKVQDLPSPVLRAPFCLPEGSPGQTAGNSAQIRPERLQNTDFCVKYTLMPNAHNRFIKK